MAPAQVVAACPGSRRKIAPATSKTASFKSVWHDGLVVVQGSAALPDTLKAAPQSGMEKLKCRKRFDGHVEPYALKLLASAR
eukprot:4406325-Pleurochrysis_carterae.AAC.2